MHSHPNRRVTWQTEGAAHNYRLGSAVQLQAIQILWHTTGKQMTFVQRRA